MWWLDDSSSDPGRKIEIELHENVAAKSGDGRSFTPKPSRFQSDRKLSEAKKWESRDSRSVAIEMPSNVGANCIVEAISDRASELQATVESLRLDLTRQNEKLQQINDAAESTLATVKLSSNRKILLQKSELKSTRRAALKKKRRLLAQLAQAEAAIQNEEGKRSIELAQQEARERQFIATREAAFNETERKHREEINDLKLQLSIAMNQRTEATETSNASMETLRIEREKHETAIRKRETHFQEEIERLVTQSTEAVRNVEGERAIEIAQREVSERQLIETHEATLKEVEQKSRDAIEELKVQLSITTNKLTEAIDVSHASIEAERIERENHEIGLSKLAKHFQYERKQLATHSEKWRLKYEATKAMLANAKLSSDRQVLRLKSELKSTRQSAFKQQGKALARIAQWQNAFEEINGKLAVAKNAYEAQVQEVQRALEAKVQCYESQTKGLKDELDRSKLEVEELREDLVDSMEQLYESKSALHSTIDSQRQLVEKLEVTISESQRLHRDEVKRLEEKVQEAQLAMDSSEASYTENTKRLQLKIQELERELIARKEENQQQKGDYLAQLAQSYNTHQALKDLQEKIAERNAASLDALQRRLAESERIIETQSKEHFEREGVYLEERRRQAEQLASIQQALHNSEALRMEIEIDSSAEVARLQGRIETLERMASDLESEMVSLQATEREKKESLDDEQTLKELQQLSSTLQMRLQTEAAGRRKAEAALRCVSQTADQDSVATTIQKQIEAEAQVERITRELAAMKVSGRQMQLRYRERSRRDRESIDRLETELSQLRKSS